MIAFQSHTQFPKRVKKEDPDNYRPVSLTSVPAKNVCAIILGVTDKNLRDNATTASHSQLGFTKIKSCLPNLISL